MKLVWGVENISWVPGNKYAYRNKTYGLSAAGFAFVFQRRTERVLATDIPNLAYPVPLYTTLATQARHS